MKPAKPKPPKVKRRYPLHAVFLIYCLVSLLVAVGAFNANNNLLFWLFGLSMGMLLVSGVISGTMMMALRIERLPIEQPVVGRPLRIRYTITNRSRWLPAIGLAISERVATSENRAHQQNAALAASPAGAVPHVPARTSIIVETLAMPTARGKLHLSGFEVLTTFPFGIIRKSLWHEAPASLIVHPAESRLPEGLLDNERGNSGAGPAATRPGRLGDEPVGVREYRPGDAPKLVSWRASARRPNGDILVRQNAEGSPRRVWVLLRLSRACTAYQTESALSAAASVIRAASHAGPGLRVGLSLRTDWEEGFGSGTSVGFDVQPRAGGASGVLLNDLSLLIVPGVAVNRGSTGVSGGPPLRGADEPRLSSTDIVVRITATGQVEPFAQMAPRHGGRPPSTAARVEKGAVR